MAVSEDKDDESIVEIMNMALDEYIEKNITNASYEDLLKGYAYEIPLEKRKRMYPTVESIEVDFRRKQKEEIQTYAKEWIDVIRINLLIGKQTNSIINSKAKTLHIKSQIFEYFIEKYPEVENMPNLKDALIRRINSEVEKIKQQNQQIGE